jgi:cell division protein FtsQ
VKRFLVIFAIVVVAAVILYSALFQVRTIHVTGNTSISEQEIIRLSGLQVGQNSMTIDDEAVMRKVEGNRYLRCTLVDVQWDSVTIHVKERVPAVHINHNGMVVVLDNRGFVLEESLHAGGDYSHLVKAIGLNVRRCALGQQIALTSATQLQTYTQILVELKAMKGIDLIAELDMSSMDSIYLTTRGEETQRFYVRLGSEESIHEKLRAFMITRDKVLQMGYTSGTIDVTDPGRPTYSP